MAITPSQWSHVLTLPESYTPSAATSGQTLVITEGVIAKLSTADQNTFWNAVQNGGGDVRICTDVAGTNQLPVEIVSLDNVAQTCVIWTRKPTYDGAGELYVFIGKSSETQPAVTDPFGRNAVWYDYAGIYNLSDGTAIDSSGGNDLTTSGAPSVVSGKIGNATRFDSSADSFNGSFIGLGNTKRTLSLWVNPDDITQNRYLSTFNGGGKSNLTAMLLGFQSGQFNAFDEGYPTGNASQTQIAATDLTWQHICYSWDGSRLKGYLNGELVVDVADTLNPATPNFLSITPVSGGGSNFYTGNLQYFGARNSGIEPNEIATEYANQNDPASFFGTPTISLTSGEPEPETELHEFSGNAIVSALSFAQISKITQHNGQVLITASAAASSTKVINVSGGVTVAAESVSLFEKLNTFNGAASVIATSQSSASKLVPFNGQATVSVTANASIIDGDLEIHSFSGGALITASASGQAMKIGIVSGSVNVTASISAQASKTALLSGNATVSTSTQSLLSKIANITGNAITRVTTLAAVLKRVTLSGASRVVATASGTFFNAESNVETYELTVQGRVKAPIVVQGSVKSLTIQGRVK